MIDLHRIKGKGLLLLFLMAVVSTSCLKNEMEEKEAEELRQLEEYVEKNGIPEEAKTESGMYYVEIEPGTGRNVTEGDYVVVEYSGRFLDGEYIETTDSATAQDEGIYNEEYIYGKTKFLWEYSIPGFTEGISYMKEGGKSRFIMPSNLAFGNYRSVIYDVELIKAIADPAEEERMNMNDYLVSVGVDPADSTESGLYYIVLEENISQTDTVEALDSLYIKYTGSFLDGRVFDENMYGIVYKSYDNSFIEGFEEALGYMREGTVARAVIPYYLAYGEQGYRHSRYQVILIPPYTSLVFDIELVRHVKN